MIRLALLALALLPSDLATPAVPVANAHTPATLVNGLAVKRNWTLQVNDFCTSRAQANASIAYPQQAGSKFKFIRTFSFRGPVSVSLERSMLDYTNAGFGVPFPWQEGQWLSRQYTAEATRGYTYLLELQDDRGGTSVCMTVFGLR